MPGGFDEFEFDDRYGNGPFSKWAKTGFLPDLIPLIPPGATLLAGSRVKPEMVGKVPGKYLCDGVWCGFKGFAQHVATAADIAEWNTWPGAGIGLLARNHPAIDIDATDPKLAAKIHYAIDMTLGPPVVRDLGVGEIMADREPDPHAIAIMEFLDQHPTAKPRDLKMTIEEMGGLPGVGDPHAYIKSLVNEGELGGYAKVTRTRNGRRYSFHKDT
jgi:hypothetical protein